MTSTIRRVLAGLALPALFTILSMSTATAQNDLPKTTTERIHGTPTVKTEQLQGTVMYQKGNYLVVKMTDGDIREFQVPESRKFIIDGKELSVHQVKVGTKLTATVTTTTTPVTERTTTIGTGRVWWVAGNTLIVTLPNHENREYQVKDDYRFIVNGKEASVHDLRKGMMISAEKIVETPHTLIASDTVVTGEAPPPPKVEVARATPRPVPAAPAPAPPPTQAAATPPPPAPVAEPPAAPATPKELPATASPLPLAGLLGLLFIGASLGLRKLRLN